MVQVKAIKAFSDNYIWCLTNKNNNQAWVVDPGQAEPVIAYLKQNKLILEGILITHHHYDHTDGVATLAQSYPNIITFGPKNSPFKGITHPLHEGQKITVLNTDFTILETPGHTLDHICYINDELAFTGDTLFSGGCGRLFEGTAAQMWQSFNKLCKLAHDTKVYCTHEYTQANLAFAKTIEPSNVDLLLYDKKVEQLRANNKTTLPSSIGLELKINPFMRTQSPTIIKNVNKKLNFTTKSNEPWENFANLRILKDNC